MTDGFIFIAIAILFNGSFSVPFKITNENFKLDPIVFQLYCSVGVFLSSWLSQAFLPVNDLVVIGAGTSFEFSHYGIISGVLITIFLCSSFFAVKYIGVALGPAILMGTALITSFLWGVKLDGVPNRVQYSIAGLVLIVIGIVGIAFCKGINNTLFKKDDLFKQSLIERESELSSQIKDDDRSCAESSRAAQSSISSLTMSIAIQSTSRQQAPKADGTAGISPHDLYLGIMWAVFSGLTGGTFLVPMQFVPPSQQGLAYLPGFGVGALVTAPVLFGLTVATKETIPEFKVREGAFLGIAAGVIWNINNVFAIAAIEILGYGLAMPLAQCAIVVASIWGIVYFKEIQGTTIAVFVHFAVILLAGAVLLCLGAQ